MQPVHALVVGAGPVGLTMAAELARHGVPCRIVDKSPEPTDKSKALVLWSRSLELLRAIGCVDAFIAAGRPAHGMSLYGEGRRLVHFTFDDVDSPYPYALMIPQSETERLLNEHLRRLGVTVERPVELIAFKTDADAVLCTLRHASSTEEVIRVRWLVGCDGAHSTVRHSLGVAFAGEPEPHDWLLADAHVKGALPADEVSIFWHEEGLLAFFPIPPDRFRVIADTGGARAADQPPVPTLAEVQAVVATRGPGDLTLLNAVWLTGFRIHERKVADYRHGDVYLAGDAAHIHSPAGGQGMNTGMQDAFNLAWKLGLVDRGRGREPLLESYNLERGAVGEAVLRNTGAMTRIATVRAPVAQQLRNRITSFLMSLEIVQQRMASALTEIDINYRSSPLSGEHRGPLAHAWLLGGGVAAGDRVPNVTLVDPATGSARDLFDILRGTHHVLLLFGGLYVTADTFPCLAGVQSAVARDHGDEIDVHLVTAGADLPGDAVWTGSRWSDPWHELHRRFGVTTDALFLIRPDGYVGYRSQPADVDGLLAHLQRYLVPR